MVRQAPQLLCQAPPSVLGAVCITSEKETPRGHLNEVI